jgi:protein Tex
MQEMVSIVAEVATSCRLDVSQVNAALTLLRAGETVPYLEHYRKSETGGMKAGPLRRLREYVDMEAELLSRREVIRGMMQERGVLTPELEQALVDAATRAELEDVYLPYASKRVSPGAHARAAGLLELADALSQDPTLKPELEAEAYVNPDEGVADVAAVLRGARAILMERWAADRALLLHLRTHIWEQAAITSQYVVEKNTGKKTKQSAKKEHKKAVWHDYMNYSSPIKNIPSRCLNMLFRGRREHVLKLTLALPNPLDGQNQVASYVKVQDKARSADAWLMETVRLVWEKKLAPKLEAEMLARLRSCSDDALLQGEAKKFRSLLLAAPAPKGVVMGLYAERRQGLGVAVISDVGEILEAVTVFPGAPDNQWQDAITTLARCVARYDVHLIGLGQEYYARDLERLVACFKARYPDMPCESMKVDVVGLSGYVTSDEAMHKMPLFQPVQRGAVSLARRIQNPLKELASIPRVSVTPGGTQNDVNPQRLARALHGVMEDVVNAIGMDMNTVDVTLLRYISGFDEARAEALVAYRDAHGPFQSRADLLHVPGVDAHCFQQAAGFLYLVGGKHALDATRIHPEHYVEVERILADQGFTLDAVLSDATCLDKLDVSTDVVRDAVRELRAPRRDPRPLFKRPKARTHVRRLDSLTVDMMLDGVVKSITTFGVFVDVGAEQPGLVHISALTNRFVRDPHEILHVGDEVRVRVIDVDVTRRRIGLSMKPKPAEVAVAKAKKPKATKTKPALPLNTAMADAFAKLKRSSS